MSTVQNIIDAVRIELSDSTTQEWTDAKLLSLVKRSVTRTNEILGKLGLEDGKAAVHTFSTADGTATYALPTDYLYHFSLWRRDSRFQLPQVTNDEWETLDSPSECVYWRLNGAYIEISGTPASVISMAFYYWPKIDVSAYTTSTTMPWGGIFDDSIVEYVALRCKNIDEMDVTVDAALVGQIERLAAGVYGAKTPNRGVEPMY